MNKLKMFFLTLTLCFVTNQFYGQVNKDSVYLIKSTDDMSDKTYIYSNRDFVVSNETKTKGFRVGTYIKNNMTFQMLTVNMVGIGSCNEKDEIIILFEDGEKITKKSWKEFNCKGEAYFNLNDDDINLLRTKEISKIRMTNGRTYDSYTGDLLEKDKRYFIQLFYSIDNGLTTEE
jgi:hypothetical protein